MTRCSVGADTLMARLASRAERPDRPEHTVNRALVGPDAAGELITFWNPVLAPRPWTHRVAAGGSLAETLAEVRRILSSAIDPQTRV